jgi:hypothetical protein
MPRRSARLSENHSAANTPALFHTGLLVVAKKWFPSLPRTQTSRDRSAPASASCSEHETFWRSGDLETKLVEAMSSKYGYFRCLMMRRRAMHPFIERGGVLETFTIPWASGGGCWEGGYNLSGFRCQDLDDFWHVSMSCCNSQLPLKACGFQRTKVCFMWVSECEKLCRVQNFYWWVI